MAIGKPSISTPRSAERDVAIAVANIRERIEAIEAELGEVNSLAIAARRSSSASSSSADLFAAQVASLTRRVSALEQAAPVAVFVNGELVGVKSAIDFRSAGQDVVIIGAVAGDRIVVTISTASQSMTVEPTGLVVSGEDVALST